MQATLNGLVEPPIEHIAGERRARQRYPLRLPVEYRVLAGKNAATGFGVTRDLSSGGIAFEVHELLHAGVQVEVSVQWPVPLDGATPLKLVVRGRLLRVEEGLAALRVQRCQFHTQRRARAAALDFAF